MNEDSETMTVPVDRSETSEEAERLAYGEKLTRDLEITLKNERSGEKSVLQKENIEAMRKVLERFPHALAEKVYGDQRVLVTRDKYAPNDTERYILSQNGMFAVSITGQSTPIEYVDDNTQVDYGKVSEFMGDEPKNNEGSMEYIVVPPEVGGLVDPSKHAPDCRVLVRRTFVRADNDNISHGGWGLSSFRQYLERVEKTHENDSLKQQKAEERKHSLNLLASQI